MAMKLPLSWSSLSWQQLCLCWQTKLRYAGSPDVARAAALLALCGCSVSRRAPVLASESTGEMLYPLTGSDGKQWVVTPRQLAQIAKHALPWFDYPYGDPGEKEVKDEKGNVVKERREGVSGYVSEFRDAMPLPQSEVAICGNTFALPQLACYNLTWQQYRSLQAITPRLFEEGNSESDSLKAQAEFLAHILVPARKSERTDDRFRPRLTYRYDADRAEQAVGFWRRQLLRSGAGKRGGYRLGKDRHIDVAVVFHICFQVYHTALLYYEKAYPLLFGGSDKSREFRDALQGEVGTVNTVMKYAGYAEQQQVYDSDLPFVLDILNTMTKEAKEIEKINSKIKR